MRLDQSVEEFEAIIQTLAKLSTPIRNVDLTCIVGESSQDVNIIKKLQILEKYPHILQYDFVTNLIPHPGVDIVEVITSPKFTKLAPVFISVYGLTSEVFIDYTKSNMKNWELFISNFERLLDLLFKSSTRPVNLYFRYDKYMPSTSTALASKIKILSLMKKVKIDDSSARANYDWAGRHPSVDHLAPVPPQSGLCLHAKEQNCIWPNGDVSQCGMVDYNKEMIKGNIFEDIQVLKQNNMHKLCEGCREYELE